MLSCTQNSLSVGDGVAISGKSDTQGTSGITRRAGCPQPAAARSGLRALRTFSQERPVIARSRRRRGNPFFWQLLSVYTSCIRYGLPRQSFCFFLAMTTKELRSCPVSVKKKTLLKQGRSQTQRSLTRYSSSAKIRSSRSGISCFIGSPPYLNSICQRRGRIPSIPGEFFMKVL